MHLEYCRFHATENKHVFRLIIQIISWIADENMLRATQTYMIVGLEA
jgi:hypothetical protein